MPLGQRPNTSVSFFNPRQIAPVSYQYNLNVQREVAPGLLIEVGYIGNVSHNLTANDFSLNQVRPELIGPGEHAGPLDRCWRRARRRLGGFRRGRR